MTRITDEMREAGLDIWYNMPGADEAQVDATYLAMFALDPEVVEMRAELAALRPVVEAAEGWVLRRYTDLWLVEAVRAWREQKR